MQRLAGKPLGPVGCFHPLAGAGSGVIVASVKSLVRKLFGAEANWLTYEQPHCPMISREYCLEKQVFAIDILALKYSLPVAIGNCTLIGGQVF